MKTVFKWIVYLLILLVGVVILAFWVPFFLFKFSGNSALVRQNWAQADLASMTVQLRVYRDINGLYPTTQQGLSALVVKPESSPAPQNWVQLFDKLPRDPWRRDYVYRLTGSPESGSFDVFSLGPDGVESGDDIRADKEQLRTSEK